MKHLPIIVRGLDGSTWVIESEDVIFEVGASGRHHHLAADVFAQLNADLTGLQRQLSSRNNYQSWTQSQTEHHHIISTSDRASSRVGTIIRAGHSHRQNIITSSVLATATALE